MYSESQLCHYAVTPALQRWSKSEKMFFLIHFDTARKNIIACPKKEIFKTDLLRLHLRLFRPCGQIVFAGKRSRGRLFVNKCRLPRRGGRLIAER